MNELVDAHCHINFFPNAGEIAFNCEKFKVHTVYVTTLPTQFDATYKYVKDLKYVYPSLGFHCLEQNYNLKKERSLFLKHIDNTKFIGEIGLDFSKKSQQTKEQQLDIFKFVLQLIKNKNKILSVHSLNAEEEVLKLLLEYDIQKAIFHWYIGKIGILNQIIKAGYYISINMAMCRSKRGQNIISKIPKNRILVETDAPFIKDLLPYRNEETYVYLSEVWGISINNTKKQIIQNFREILNFKNKDFYERYKNVNDKDFLRSNQQYNLFGEQR